ncbi:Inositol polyphosphate 5-phosphatase K, partial [Cladochytrium tenue]
MKSRAKGLVFGGFEEGDLAFDPTYKFDNGTTIYDTSEKARCVIIDAMKRDLIREEIYERKATSANAEDPAESVQEPLKFRQKSKFVRPPSGALLIDMNGENWTVTGTVPFI